MLKNVAFNKYIRAIALVLLTVILSSSIAFVFEEKASAANVVVCIDPGHGGSNLGASYYGKYEKDQTLIIGLAMYEELSKYDGITVVMTRTDDSELSLAQRAQIASDAGAEFLYSLHLNASEEHKFYGAEVWTSGFDSYYSRGQIFGNIVLDELSSQCGIYARKGAKCKLSDSGADYYGVINNSTKNDVVGVIIEHCHMDTNEDYQYWRDEAALRRLGVADATAVAKYYGLRSRELGVDYSEYAPMAVPVAAEPMDQDLTEPEYCIATLISLEGNAGLFEVSTADDDSGICYYSYSKNGGKSWSRLFRWDEDNVGTIDIYLPEGQSFDVIVRTYNYYQLYTESNVIHIN